MKMVRDKPSDHLKTFSHPAELSEKMKRQQHLGFVAFMQASPLTGADIVLEERSGSLIKRGETR